MLRAAHQRRRRFCPPAFPSYFWDTSRRHMRQLCRKKVAKGGYKESHAVYPKAHPSKRIANRCVRLPGGLTQPAWTISVFPFKYNSIYQCAQVMLNSCIYQQSSLTTTSEIHCKVDSQVRDVLAHMVQTRPRRQPDTTSSVRRRAGWSERGS